jgi:hypothetical protein
MPPRRSNCRERAIAGARRVRQDSSAIVIRRLEIRRFRGFEHVVIVPTGHALVVGEPDAGRSDVMEGLRRVLSPDSTRFLLGDDIDFFQRDRTFRAEVEVVLGDLGPALTQQFFDWPRKSRAIPAEDRRIARGATTSRRRSVRAPERPPDHRFLPDDLRSTSTSSANSRA